MTVDESTVVSGTAGSAYHCPDLAAVDGHLEHLRRCLTVDDESARRYVLADIDLLLDYRAIFARVNAEPPRGNP